MHGREKNDGRRGNNRCSIFKQTPTSLAKAGRVE